MSGGGFRGRGFGHRGGRSKGPGNGFGGPRFPRPNFNRPRPPHSRLPNNRSDNWVERPHFVPWQRPQFRGNSQFRPNARGRSLNGPRRGRFPGPGRPPGDEFYMGYARNVRQTIPFQEDQVHDVNKIASELPAPLPGSEEERQQKISETADKLKQKLSSITEEDLTNLWEDDSANLPSCSSKAEAGKSKGIPELKHHPPELNLTFTDLRDIGRVDCNNARFDNLHDVSNASDDVILESANFEIVELNENERGSVDIIDLEKDIGDPGPPLLFLDDDNCHGSHMYEPFGAENNSRDFELSCSEINDNLVSENFGDTGNGVFVSDVDNTIDFTLDQPLDGTLNNLSIDFSHTKDIPGSINIFQNQDVSDENIIETQDVLGTDIQQDENVVEGNLCQTENTWETNDLQEVVEGNLCETENAWQTNDPQEVVEGNLCQTENTWQTNDTQEVVEGNVCQTENTWQTNDPQEVVEGNLCETENTWQTNDPQEVVEGNLCQTENTWQTNDTQEVVEGNLCQTENTWQTNDPQEVVEGNLCETENAWQTNDPQEVVEGNLCQTENTWQTNDPQEVVEGNLCETENAWQTNDPQEVVEGNLCQTENTWQTNDQQEVVEENLCQSQDNWHANDLQEVVEENLFQAEDNWQENNQPEVAEEYLPKPEATLQENDSQDLEGNLCQPQDTWEANILQEAAKEDMCQTQDSLQTDNLQEENDEISKNITVVTDATLSPPPPCNEEDQSDIACDTQPGVCSPYAPLCILEKDEELNSPSNLHPRTFNEPPRFGPRIPGPKCHRNFQQNSQNSRVPGRQRFPIHRNTSPPRHAKPFVQTDPVPAVHDSRAPPPFNPNIPLPTHDSQHNSFLPCSPNDLTSSFDPTEPLPNVRSIATSETSSSETMQPTTSFDSRNASSTASPKDTEVFELPPAFDPRGPPPTITSIVLTKSNEKLPGFNSQHRPPMIINKEGILPPPPMFDGQLPSPENALLIAPMPPITDFSMVSMNANFLQPPPIAVPLPQTFIPNMQMNFQAVLQPTSMNEINEIALPPPVCLNKENIPLLPLDAPSDENKHLGEQQTINMEDGLEDLRKAMEFANEVMHMGGEDEVSRNMIGPVYLDMPLPSEIPVPATEQDVPHTLSLRQLNLNKAEKSKKTKNKLKNKAKQDNIYNSETSGKKQEITEQTTVEVGNAQDQSKSSGDELPSIENMRPKVVFNLNSKIKKINAVEEWNQDSEETKHKKQKGSDGKRNNLHQIMIEEQGHTYEKDRSHQLKVAKNVAAEKSKDRFYQRDHVEKSNDSSHRRGHTEKSNDVSQPKDHIKKSNDLSYHRDHTEKLNDVPSHRNHAEKSCPQVSSATTSTNVDTPKRKKIKKIAKKIQAPTSESTWKTSVINRFLKMSRNDICNMINNSSLRKFDIAMKHLVKEGRPSLSLKMRTTEDEKMKEYDREEFMSQLNAMLDPGAVVAITDLPTEFIHHLSEVLQLDPMPTDSDTLPQESAVINEPEKQDQSIVPNMPPSEDPTNESLSIELDIVHVDREITKATHGNKSKSRDITAKPNATPSAHVIEEFSNAYYPVDNTLLDPGPSQEEGSSSKKFTGNRTRQERETIPKKQQLLFNEDDLDNILSEVTQRTKRDPPNPVTSQNLPRKPTHVTSDARKTTMPSIRADFMKHKEASPQIRIRAAADLDDIFSAGIARAKRKTARSDYIRSRKSTSEERSTIRAERYERWSRKERENPDTFRNLTKEEWEARYARPMSSASSSSTIRRSGSNSSENLNRERRNYTAQRFCSSDSPMRHLSISPMTQDHPPISIEKYYDQYEPYEESRTAMRTVSSSDSTFSSTDSSDTTVAPDVTKLLKVIKEKEKIAKTKSLNETIRDEVAAEIEMKWREKSKHKERKCRKREKRKRDKRDRRKKEKRRKRRRSCTSSDRSDVSEEHRLLTESEIKKEVIVKEEQDVLLPVPTSRDNVIAPPTLSCTNATGSVVDNLHNQSHGSGTQKPLVPIATCNPEQLPVKSKPITSPIQPKTKAQLKQMPESSDMVRSVVIESSAECVTNKPRVVNIANVVQNDLRKHMKKCKNDEVASYSANEQECKLLSTNNNSLQQTDTSLTVEKSQCTKVVERNISQPTALTVEKSQCTKVVERNISQPTALTVEKSQCTKVIERNISQPTALTVEKSQSTTVVESNISEPTKATSVTIDAVGSSVKLHPIQQCTPTKLTATSTPGSTENKGGSKKIDIKAYKERALRRQLKEQTSAKEISPPHLSPQIALEVAKVQSEPLVTEKQARVTEKDKVELALVPSYDRSDKESDTISTLKDPRKSTPTLQQNTELPDLKNKEISETAVVNANVIIAENSDGRKDTNTNSQSTCSSGTINESLAQGAIADKSETAKSRIKMQSKSSSQGKLKRLKKSAPVTASDPSKFKNIRSEGRKELKLKKEKVKKPREIASVEQTNEIKSSRVNTIENRLQAKHSLIAGKECALDAGAQKLSVSTANNTRDETDDNVNSEKSNEILRNLQVPGDSTTRGDENTRNSLVIVEIDENPKIEEQVDVRTAEEKVLLILKDEKNIIKKNTAVSSDDTRTSDNLCVFATVEKDDVEESAIEENLTKDITFSDKLQSSVEDSDALHKLEESIDVADKVPVVSNEQVPVDGEQYTNKENNVQELTNIPVNTAPPLDMKVNANLIYSINSTNSDIDKNNMDNDEPVFQSPCDGKKLESTTKDRGNVLEQKDLETNGTTSPGSIDSPFKGFLAESIEDNICKVSMIANIEASVQDIKEELMANSKKWKLDMNLDTTYGKNNTTSKHAVTDKEQSVFKSLENERASLSTIDTVGEKLPDDSDQEATIGKDAEPGKNNILEKEDSITTKEVETNEVTTAVANNVPGLKEKKGTVPQDKDSATTKEQEPNKTATDAAKVVLHVKEKKDSMPEKRDSITTKQLKTNGAPTSVLKNKLTVKSEINNISEKENSVTSKALETNETAKVVVKDVLRVKERRNSTLGKEDSVATKVFETDQTGIATGKIEQKTKEGKNIIPDEEDSVKAQELETNEAITATAENELNINKWTESISEEEDSFATKDFESNPTATEEDSQSAFDKDNEQFITLDEYLDKSEVNSQGAPSPMEVNSEDYSLKNQDNLLDKKPEGKEGDSGHAKCDLVQVSSSVKETKEKTRSNDAKTLDSENTTGSTKKLHTHKIKQKNTAASMDPSSSISVESVAEQSVKSHVRRSKSLEKSSKSMDSSVREISAKARKSSRTIERDKTSPDTITKDASQEPVGAESLRTEVEKTEEKNRQCNHISKNNADSVKVPKRLHVPTKAALKKSVDIVISPVAHTSTTETNAPESLELKPAKQPQNSEKRNDDASHSRTNDSKLNDNVRTDSSLQSSGIKLLNVNSLKHIPVVEIEKSKILDDMAGKKQKLAETVEDQLGRAEEYDALRKIKHKPKMKHKEKKKQDISEKKIKDTVISGNVQFRDPHSKEAIMARMIEIDVEIHKLMTEKMTLYQMLKTDASPFENNLLSNEATCEIKETESVAIPSPNPAVLVSKLIQNIETNPVVTGHPIVGTVGAALKENRADSPQPGKHKVSSKHEHNSRKRDTPCYSSDDEEVMHYTESAKFSDFKKRKKHKSDKNVTWDSLPVSSGTSYDISSPEKKKTKESTKSVLKKVNNIGAKEITEQSTTVAPIAEVKVQGIVTEASIEAERKDTSTSDKSGVIRSSSRMDKTIAEPTEVQDSVEKRNKSKTLDSTDKFVSHDNQDQTEILDESSTINSETKLPEDRTPERSTIYSDESTWESFQNAGSDTNEQKRPSTGLALLEKSYRKEMERSRKMKAEALKKKQSRGDVSKTVLNLTTEEEELPLSKLYSKKVRRSKDVANTVDQKGEKSNFNDDPQFWRNALAVIDAVAEDRVQELYTRESAGESKEDSGTDTPMNKCVIPSSLLNVDQLNKDVSTNSIPEVSHDEPKENASLCTSKNVEESNVGSVTNPKDVTSSEIIIQETEDLKSDDVQSAASAENLQIEDAVDDTQNNTEFNPQSSADTLESSSTQNDVTMKESNDGVCVAETMSDSDRRIELTSSSMNTDAAQSNAKLCHSEDVVLHPSKVTSLYAEEQTEVQMKEDVRENAQVPSVSEDSEVKSDDSVTLKNYAMDETARIEDVFNTDTVTKTSNSAIEAAEEAGSITLRAMVCENQKLNADNNPETSNLVPKTDYPLDVKESKESQNNAKKLERSTDALRKDSSNETHVSISSRVSANIDTHRNEDLSGRKSSSRKRHRSKTGLRRSSRYTEENSKRMKLADDVSTQSNEQDVREKNLNVNLTIKPSTPLSSHDEETDTPTNIKKIRGTPKLPANRKQAMRLESGISENPLVAHDLSLPSKEASKHIKKRKQHTMLEMMSCRVRLIDSKYTILRPNINPEVLKKLGISRINQYAHPKSAEVDSTTNPLGGASTKEPDCDAKRMTSITESKHNQSSKLSQNSEDAAKMKKMQRPSAKQPLCPSTTTHVAESSELDVQVIKEQITVDVSKVVIAPEIEIVEEKKSVTKSQVHDDPGTTLPVIESKDDKELSRTQYTVHKGPILDIKVFESSFLAASEDGRIYRYSQASNGILNIYKGHKSAVTCLYVYSTGLVDHNKNWMFSGSLDGTLRCYNITTGGQMRDTADVGSPIQCMDQAWGVIFVGTKSGHVSRYHIKSGAIKGNSIQFSDKSVLALKATNEGPRRVLIVASRSQPITIRDAQSGLFLRTICGERSHTVYSLMRHHNFIYCGTSSTSILVFDFTNGDQTTQYDAGVGIVCMRLYKQLLFAGCYDGNIYVFDTKDYRLICSIPGPGNMLLSMEIIDNKIIAGSKDKRLQSWLMPRQVRALL